MDEKHALAAAVITVTWDPRRKRWTLRGQSRGQSPVVVHAETSIDWDPAVTRLLVSRCALALEELLPFLANG